MAIEQARLNKLPFRGQMIPRGDDRITPYRSDTLMTGDPDLVCRPSDSRDLSEILAACSADRIPVTFCGSRTCLTGASVALEGVLVAMEQCNRLLDISIDPGSKRPQATAEPGILLGDFKRQIAEAGYFYPPDPTSWKEAQLGGTVGTNATGEDSLLYGPTRRYIRRLKLLSADGCRIELVRKKPYRGPIKNRGGYYLKGDPIEPFIGSEGTLGLVTEVTVDLLPASKDHFVAWAFFPDLVSALDFVVTSQSTEGIRPRALELIDRSSLEFVVREERAPEIPAGTNCVVVFKQEYENLADRDLLLGRWLSLLATNPLSDAVQVATDSMTQERFRLLRHAVPSGINEEAARLVPFGGGKRSTDWWVPLTKLHRMMAEAVKESEALGVRYFVYGHIGDGHPHINYVARDHDEMTRVRDLLARQCRRAVSYGGGVAGEHGLGKIHSDLLPVQCSLKEIDIMKKFKEKFDPGWILGRGNIFPLRG